MPRSSKHYELVLLGQHQWPKNHLAEAPSVPLWKMMTN